MMCMWRHVLVLTLALSSVQCATTWEHGSITFEHPTTAQAAGGAQHPREVKKPTPLATAGLVVLGTVVTAFTIFVLFGLPATRAGG
jgi:hypothetical protein